MALVFLIYMLVSLKIGWGIQWYDWVIFSLMVLMALVSVYFQHKQAIELEKKAQAELAAMLGGMAPTVQTPDEFSRISDEEPKDQTTE